MRMPTTLAALCLAVTAAPAAPPPVYLWHEAEWFDGVKGSFAYWTGKAAPSGAWGVAGPGISAEWTQGGESEWNSIGAAAAETKAVCGRDLVIPRAGRYFSMWSGVGADPKWWSAQKTETLTLADVFYEFGPPKDIKKQFAEQFRSPAAAPLMTWPNLLPGFYLGQSPDLSPGAPLRA